MPTSSEDLARLTTRLSAGDRAAFEALFRLLHVDLVRYAGSLTEDGAEDAVQEAFLSVWRRRESLDPGRSIKALLYTSVRNALYNQSRDVSRREELHGFMSEPDAPTPPDDTLDASLLGDRLRGWILDLPDRQREAFHLSRFDSLSYVEIADVMACSTKTVENHVGRALHTLRDRLRQYAPDTLLP